MNYNFKEDIKDGEKGEKVIVEFLKTEGYQFVNDNKNNKYDIKMISPNGSEQTFEIKTDVWCIPDKSITLNGFEVVVQGNDNGNMFIEIECRGKESGLNVTKAKWFVTYFPYLKEVWFIKVSKLKLLCENNNFPISTNAGDIDSNTKGYLIPRNEYKDEFKIVNINHVW